MEAYSENNASIPVKEDSPGTGLRKHSLPFPPSPIERHGDSNRRCLLRKHASQLQERGNPAHIPSFLQLPHLLLLRRDAPNKTILCLCHICSHFPQKPNPIVAFRVFEPKTLSAHNRCSALSVFGISTFMPCSPVITTSAAQSAFSKRSRYLEIESVLTVR